VGPAELVRQGGWLLWDVPSLYGFLSILMLAALPVGSVWQAFYLLNALLTLIAGAALFLWLSRVHPGPVGWLVGLITTLSVTFVMYYGVQDFLATQLNPQTGPYRFVWCFVLLGLLLGELRTAPGSRAQRAVLLCGCLVWLLGILWSAEMAVYSSLIWLPAYVLIVLRDRVGLTGNARPSRVVLYRAVAWLAVPPLLLGGAVGLIVAYYMVRLGHPPDFRTYVDYAIAFGDETTLFVQLPPVDPRGPVLGILLLLGLIAGAAVAVFRGILPLRLASIVLGLWGALWAIGSYVVHWPDPIIIMRTAPLACAAVAILLLLAATQREPNDWGFVLRTAAVPLLVMLPHAFVILSSLVAHASPPDDYREATRAQFNGATDIQQLLPRVVPTLQELLTTAGVSADAPLVYGGDPFGNLMPGWTAADGQSIISYRSWLPAKPLTLAVPLSNERKQVYSERFINRTELGGWLIQRKVQGRIAALDPAHPGYGYGYGFGLDGWVFDVLPRTHAPTRIYENADWQLVWFDYVGEDPDVVRPTYPDWGLGALPDDVRVDKERLSDVAQPQLWVLYGAGWAPDERRSKGRQMDASAHLWIYSPSARSVELQLSIGSGDPGQLSISANDAAPAWTESTSRKAEGELSASIVLRAGWNELMFTLAAQEPKQETPAAAGIVIERIDIRT
jgi:hypothetical protein